MKQKFDSFFSEQSSNDLLKYFFYTSAILFFLFFSSSFANELNEYFQNKYGKHWLDVAFDIDGTLAYRNSHPRHGQSDVIVQGHPYKFSHGAVEFLAALEKMGVTISFFSAGEASRNDELLAALYKKVNKKTGLLPQPYSVLSQQLVPPDGKKNLNLLISKNLDLNRTILVDDHPFVSYEGQNRNLLSIYYDIDDVMTDWEKPESKADQIGQVRLKNNLIRAAGIFIKALENSKKNGSEIADELALLESMIHKNDRAKVDATNTKEVYLAGLKVLQTIDQNFELYTEKSYFSPYEIVYPYSSVRDAKDEGKSDKNAISERILKKLLKKVHSRRQLNKAHCHPLPAKPVGEAAGSAPSPP